MSKRLLTISLCLSISLTAVFSFEQQLVLSEIPQRITGKDGTPMVLIPDGEFQMGSSNGRNREKPVHTVYVDAFYMDVYEVTNAQYRKFVEATGHEKSHHRYDRPKYNQPNQPVIGVSWESAVAYCEWAGKRLPTEAEWEKAVRGGLVGKKYPLGDSVDPSQANYGHNVGQPTAVGNYLPNAYGIYDMIGNVGEWCADWYRSDYYQYSPKQNPTGPVSSREGTKFRVVRGGHWGLEAKWFSCASRRFSSISVSRYNHGFRCAALVSP